jgi:Uma2 family endonuclease
MATATLPALKPDRSTADEPLHEIVRGERVELPEMAARSNVVKSDLHVHLGSFVRQHRIGWAACETLFILDEFGDEQRRPDIAFVSAERWPLDREVPLEADWQVVPDLAIEVGSTHDKLADFLIKIEDYFTYGVRQVWYVFPEKELVYVYDSPTQIHILTRHDRLENAQLLPGFSLPLSDLFPATTTTAAPAK